MTRNTFYMKGNPFIDISSTTFKKFETVFNNFNRDSGLILCDK